MNPKNVWPTVTMAIAAAVIVGAMAVAKVDKDIILLVVGVLLVPVITGLLAAQGAANATAIQAVREQTNGNTSRLLDLVQEIAHLLAAAPATVPPSTVDTPPPVSTVDGSPGGTR